MLLAVTSFPVWLSLVDWLALGGLAVVGVTGLALLSSSRVPCPRAACTPTAG